MLNKPKLIYCNKHKIIEALHIQGCLHYNMELIDIFSEPFQKKSTPPKNLPPKSIDYQTNKKIITYKYSANIENFLLLVNLF